ncbi:hypothetical protein [Catellatospora sp. NPDC049609]|uniref:hypothetical protein n=1 Tax=Catellatospora sp. NPDC049609 TaxID=3155505 RepID=UPI003443BC15
MANVKFKFNRAGLEQAANQAVLNWAAEHQPVLDRVFASHAGKPVDEVKAAVVSAWRAKTGKTLPDADATSWATPISEGQRLVLQPKR